MIVAGSSQNVTRAVLTTLALAICGAGTAASQDVMTVGSVALAEPGQQLLIPVFLRDLEGTALDGDDGPGRTIQSLALTVRITPPGSFSLANLDRAGIATNATPIFETQISPGDRRTLLMTFDENADPLPSTLGGPPPGDLIALLALKVAADFDADTILLQWFRATTALGNQEGAVTETQANGQLTLIDGGILVDSSGIFVDGFESGDTGAWSSAVP